MDERPALHMRQRKIFPFALDQFTEQQRLAGERFRRLVLGKQTDQLVAERRGAGRFEDDERGAGADFGAERIDRLAQQMPGQIEHAPIVQRAAAAQRTARDGDAKSRFLRRQGSGDRAPQIGGQGRYLARSQADG